MENNDDKTIIYSNNTNNSTNSNIDSDKTIISEPSACVGSSQLNSEPQKTNSAEPKNDKSTTTEDKKLEENKEILKEKSITKSNGIHPGAFAAGVAAAAAGGVAAGTVFSEEIKDFFTKDTVEEAITPPAVESEVPEATETAEISEQNNETGIEMPEGVSALNISGVTNEGNSFEVSFMDLDNNGVADMQFAEIDLGDGSTFEIFQTGDSLDTNFFAGLDNAQFENSSEISFANLSNTIETDSRVESYTIQPGDTLSDIAAAHDTSVENIMELNADIENPDLIYAGNNLQIPSNDGIENPYQMNSSSDNPLEFAETFTPDNSLTGTDENMDYTSNEGDGLESQNFDNVDWDSFEDQPVDYDDSDYGQLLADADFDNTDVTSDFV